MFIKKLKRSPVNTLFLLIGFLFYLPLYAASEKFCDDYANKSVAQFLSAEMYDCNVKGSRWSSDFYGQKKWCKSVRQAIPMAETKARYQALKQCGVGTSKSWSTLHYQRQEDYIQMAIGAANSNNVQTLKTLKQAGASITAPAMQGNDGTPLAYAISSQSFDAMRYLLKFSSPNQASNAGLSPLSKLLNSKKINYKLLRYLLQNGASAEYMGNNLDDSSLPLYIAVTKKDIRALRELLHIGKANPNSSLDQSILIKALKLRYKTIILELIYAGADVNQTGGMREGMKCSEMAKLGSQKMPLDYALEMGDGAVIYTIRKRGGKTQAQCSSSHKKN